MNVINNQNSTGENVVFTRRTILRISYDNGPSILGSSSRSFLFARSWGGNWPALFREFESHPLRLPRVASARRRKHNASA